MDNIHNDWDQRISTFVDDVKLHEKHPWKIIGRAAIEVGFSPCTSRNEKRYVREKLDKISTDLRNDEINNGNYTEFLDGAERLISAETALERPKEVLLQQMIAKLEKLKPATQENILPILKERYPWYNWGGSQ